MLPNFFIGGATKAGTSTLHELLKSHKDIFFPPRVKEYYFFDHDANYAEGLRWLESLYVQWNGEKAVGQTSPSYLLVPDVPARMHAYLPDAKLIFILRNPIDRAYSHYWHSVRLGGETLPFERALEREPERLAQVDTNPRVPLYHQVRYSYVSGGYYAQQINRFLDYFSRDQLLVLFYDNLKKNPHTIAMHCAEFLDISLGRYRQDPTQLGVHNPARIPPFRVIPELSLPMKTLLFRLYLSHYADRKLRRKYNFRYPPMKPATRSKLRCIFRDDICALQKLVGIDLQHWLR